MNTPSQESAFLYTVACWVQNLANTIERLASRARDRYRRKTQY